jgi:hypothetical protein
MLLLSLPSLSVTAAITTTASTPTITLVTTQAIGLKVYRVRATQNCWVAQGATPTATAGSGSDYLAIGQELLLDGSNGAHVSVKADTTSGNVTITPMLRT